MRQKQPSKLIPSILRRYPDVLVSLLWLLTGLIWIQTFPPESRLDMDEGVNLMKARLVSDGFVLYRDIWSDQPPGFTHLLAWWAKLFSDSPNAARALVLVMSTLGLISMGRIAVWLSGTPHAGAITVLLALGARNFPKLSLAVMIGLPSIAAAALACWLIVLFAGRRRGWIGSALAGAVFAASMQIKLFSFILVPFAITLFFLALRRRSASRGRWAIESTCLALGFVLFSAAVLPWNEPSWRQQLISPHLRQNRAGESSQLDVLRQLAGRIVEDAPLMIAAGICFVAAPRPIRRQCLAPAVWFACSLVVLSQANPLWSHHRLMLTIPAALLAGVAFSGLAESRSRGAKGLRLARAAVAVAMLYGAARLATGTQKVGTGRTDSTADVLRALRENSSPGEWIVTDDPFAAYQAGLRSPPSLAVITYKRLVSGQLTDEMIAKAIDEYDPPLILVARFADANLLPAVVQSNYREVFRRDQNNDDRPEVILYRRNPPPSDEQTTN